MTVPKVRGLDASLPVPEIKATVWHIDSAGVTQVATGTGSPSRTLEVELTRPGAYRVEISIIPRHLGPYLRDLGTEYADHELPWIYANPIYVQ